MKKMPSYQELVERVAVLEQEVTRLMVSENSLSLQELIKRFPQLSFQEARVAELVRSGKKAQEIARALEISKRTVESHMTRIRRKLGIRYQKVNLRGFLAARLV